MAHALHTVSDDPGTMYPGDEKNWTVTQVAPEASCFTEGYWLNIPGACLWEQNGEYVLCTRLQTVHLPLRDDLQAYYYFRAIDSRGNHYKTGDRCYPQQDPHIRIGGMHVSGNYKCLSMDISGIPSADIQWIELHYDRDGRDIVQWIDLQMQAYEVTIGGTVQ